MERSIVMGITAATVTGVALCTLLLGCSTGDDTGNPCGGQPIVYVEQDDDETEYHCGSPTGAVVPIVLIDVDTRERAKQTPGKAVPFKPAPAPKVNTDKQPAPVKPAVPAKPAPAPKSGAKR